MGAVLLIAVVALAAIPGDRSEPIPTPPELSVPVQLAAYSGPVRLAGGVAELPRVEVDVSMPAMTGEVIRVPAGGNLQAAINAAERGDVVELQAGAEYAGSFTLPAKAGEGWVVIRSSGWRNLPEGERVGPEDAPLMAKLKGGQGNVRVLRSAKGASHYRIIGLEIAPDTRKMPRLLTALVDFVNSSHHLILDRSYVHSTPTQELMRCVLLNSGAAAIIDSYVDECHAKGVDSQAIVGWNGSGPYLIENNFLAGAAENILFGGAKIGTGAIPSDIVIRRNHIYKPLSWKGVWLVKTLIELKIANRVLIEENVLENCWPDGQTGFAMVFKSENRDKDRLPDIATEDVTVRNNRILNSTRGLNITGRASRWAVTGKGRTSRVLVENNEWQTKGGVAAFQFLGELYDLVVKNNTAAKGYMNLEGPALEGFVFQGNILGGRIKAGGIQQGSATLEAKIAPGGVFADNVIVGLRHARLYPTRNGNLYPAALARYRGFSGADLSAVKSELASALSGDR